jgi:hypothetical protein
MLTLDWSQELNIGCVFLYDIAAADYEAMKNTHPLLCMCDMITGQYI